MKNLCLWSVILCLALPAPMPAKAATPPNCNDVKNKLIPDGFPKDEAQLNRSCTRATERSVCLRTQKRINEISRQIETKMTALCTYLSTAGSRAGGAANTSQAATAEMTAEINRTVASLQPLLTQGARDMGDASTQHQEISRRILNADTSSPTRDPARRLQSRVSEVPRLPREEVRSLRQEVRSNSHPAQDQIASSISAAHARALWESGVNDLNRLKGAGTNVRNTADDNNNRTSSVSGGMGLKDMIPLLAAAAPLAMLLKPNPSADTSSVSNPAAQNATSQQATELAPTQVAGTKINGTETGSTGNGPSFAVSQSQTPGAEFATVAGGEEQQLLANSISSPNDGKDVLKGFDGGLGGSPFSGSSTTLGGAAGGAPSAGSSPAAAAAAGIADVLNKDTPGELAHGGGSGGAGFGGGGLGSDPGLKDLFKTPDLEKTDGGLGAGFGDLGLGEGGFGADGATMGSSIPGAENGNTLFSRVRETHRRCIKRGCVTSEAGGKI